MKAESECLSQFEELNVTPCGFLQGARCTNVNTFGILPHPLSALRNEASELGFCGLPKSISHEPAQIQ
ncbi:hypothetical protein SAMN05660236_4818 [Ohtaekwangia koreensis]|uniref:Uncharacterized protein n=1 Tax=Ohtaekwangia koreensis TaxID=688867 RepID=A0A1T5MA22_9BACT|nr:hypothetical protein SAMN05660236_4818 [Ohtaekwangia koreensis]